jgi:hypothetical protein
MHQEQIDRLVRHFPENGLKLMLENAGNVHDLLRLLRVRAADRIDFGRMRVEPAHFVQRDYRHLESDVVLSAPLRAGRRGRERLLTIYILIEHQSKPDHFMVFRVLEYVLQIYRRQMRDWEQAHGSLDDFRFQPVLPVVLYSGTRTWERLAPFVELLEEVEELPEGLTPEFLPLFLNVGRERPEALESEGGAFGLLLRLVQQRRARRAMFEELLRRVVRGLEEQLADTDRERWLGLLSYLQALIYHERERPEQEPLQRLVADSVQNDRHRREVFDMGKTIAEALKDEGRAMGKAEEAVEARRKTLLRQLRLRFKRVPEQIVRRVEATTDVTQLEAWLDGVVTARKLTDVRIPPLE